MQVEARMTLLFGLPPLKEVKAKRKNPVTGQLKFGVLPANDTIRTGETISSTEYVT
jgi:hypothetical protein